MSTGTVADLDDIDIAKEALRAVMLDPTAPAAARAAAARTVLELNGALGRNAAPPIDPSKPTSELSRGDLLAELALLEAAERGT
jgi:hypothetical protein